MLWFLACTSDPIQDTSTEQLPCWQRTPQVNIGTGEYVWETIEELDPVVMVHGPQGGWHMLGSVQVKNTLPIIEVDFVITEESSGAQVSSNHYRVAMIMEDECSGYYPGMYGYLNVAELESGELDTPPELLADKIVTFDMSINDCTEAQDERNECVREDRWSHTQLRVKTQLDEIDMPQE